ncbi:LOB domain-containing protein 36-like [Phoenix dactylifera]|uniref:LOB domain-containing protein 36-like n=1 Tax=Phoenix dactylifera TaxID=42345 RepID=A0A8B8J5V3_PHODC|nr:LOB domain-containing protein 36-like [Phoenix dactylifera]XP_038971673.1 LOB domain-containing protein 36-like [Phoenix dactylifera]XP_038971674.1 LOB domain-containing protein 36-like [Phoenix dactylifera]
MSSSNSPCAACKFLRRKCTQGCVFAPYFPPDQPQKFANVHRIFGASNVAKLLNELSPAQREDAVNSLAYEAEARLRDPVYGCVGYISLLQHKLKQVQHDLYNAKKELSAYIGPAALSPFLPHPGPHHHHHHHAALVGAPHHYPPYQLQGASPSSAPPFGVPGMGIGMGLALAAGAGTGASPHHPQILMREQQQQMAEAQQLAVAVAAVREQEMLRSYEQQQELARFGTGYTDGRAFNQIGVSATVAVAPGTPPGLALVSPQPIETPFLVQHLQQYPEQPRQQQRQARPQHQRAGSDEGSSGMGPSS